jgi:two-component system, sensor histidine kinase
LLAEVTGSGPARRSELAVEPSSGPSAKPPGPEPASRRRCRVLLAEDNAINALLARSMLEKQQCDVTVVGDGRAAVDAMRATFAGAQPAYDLIFMDLHMPEMDGLEAVAVIRHHARQADIAPPPIIALTANAFPEDRQRCLDAGMDAYLAKPFDRTDLERMLSRWVLTPPPTSAMLA